MQALIDLVRRLDRRRLKKINILKPSSTDNLHNKLYHGIVSGNINDEKGIEALYGESLESKSSMPMSKMRFKEKVLNLTFFLNINSFLRTPIARKSYQATRYGYLAKMLPSIGANKMALWCAHKAIQIARKVDNIEVLFDNLKMYLTVAAREGDKTYWEDYNMLFHQVRKRKQALDDLEVSYSELLYWANSNQLKQQNELDLQLKCKEMDSLAQIVNSPRSKELAFLSKSVFFQHIGDYLSLGLAAKKFSDFLKTYPYATNRQVSQVIGDMIAVALHTEDYEKGIDLCERVFPLIPKGARNLLKFKELHFLLLMRAKLYETALAVLDEVVASDNFHNLPEIDRERWLIYEPFALFALRFTSGTNTANKQRLEQFNILKFLNSVPFYSKDKEHFNVHIRVAQIMHHLSYNDHDELIDKADALKMYDKRYMRRQTNDKYHRSHYFVQALLCLPKSDFEPKRVKQKASKHIQQLKELSYNMYQNDFREIIPYEVLWEMILGEIDHAA